MFFRKLCSLYSQLEKEKVEMASQSQGIQQLLAAEKKAAERVADARKSMPSSRTNYGACTIEMSGPSRCL